MNFKEGIEMIKINIDKRNLNNNNKKLRKQGFAIGSIYGANFNSIPVKAHASAVKNALAQVGEIYKIVTPDGPIMATFDEVQKDPVTNEIIHFSLLHTPRGHETELGIPINLTGTPAGVKKGGHLVHLKDEVTISGKPGSMPKLLNADVSDLNIGDKLVLADLDVPTGINVEENKQEVVVVCKPPIKASDLEIDNEENFFDDDEALVAV